MKFSVSSKTLYAFASAVSKVINAKNPMAILNNFLFTLEGDTLTVKAADMENSLVGRLNVTEAQGDGSFCLDARRIVELLKELPDQGILFEIKEETLEVKISYSNGVYNTMAISGAEYPGDKPEENGIEETFVAGTADVIHGIENTLFAVSTDEIRPQMMGILWDVRPDSVIFVSTDTRKLVKYTNSAIKPGVACSFILPVKGATVLKNVFSKEDEIKITVSPTAVLFESESFTFDCRLIKGNFPPYDRVIPSTNSYILTVDRLSLLTAVRRVAVFGDEGGGLIRMRLSANSVELNACDNSFGTFGKEEVPCDYTGKDLTIGFGSQYLVEILSTLSTPDVVIKLADPSRAALFLPGENDPESELLMILMPMNIVD